MDCPPVVFLCASPTHGDAHWRCLRPAARLAEAGVDARVCWLGDDLLPTVPVAGRVVVVQRAIVGNGDPTVTQAWVARLRAAGALAVLADLDDDEISGAQIAHMVATQPITRAARETLEQQARGHIAMLQAVDGVTVSTKPLATIVRQFTDTPVHVVPNAIDTEWFRERLAPRSIDPDHLTIGWAGWWRPEADLAPMAEAWARIAARYPDVRFVVAGHQSDVIYRQPIDLERFIILPIAPLDRYPTLYQVDIGCCAVADSPFSRCKSPIKAWEYALAGAAVVTQGDIYDRQPGTIHVFDVNGWEATLSFLLENADHRQWCRATSRADVERNHSLAGQLHVWAEAHREIVASVGVRV